MLKKFLCIKYKFTYIIVNVVRNFFEKKAKKVLTMGEEFDIVLKHLARGGTKRFKKIEKSA